MTNDVFGKDLQDVFKVIASPEGHEIFVKELQAEINREVVESIMNYGGGIALIEQAKRNEAMLASETSNKAAEEALNPEMEIGDYAVLYEVNQGKGIFVPHIYKITAFNMIENTKHIYTVELRPIRTVGPGSFDDHIVTMTLDRIAFYHNKEIICEELLEDHRRWLTGKRADERVHRLVELNLLAKCKYPKNNF